MTLIFLSKIIKLLKLTATIYFSVFNSTNIAQTIQLVAKQVKRQYYQSN